MNASHGSSRGPSSTGPEYIGISSHITNFSGDDEPYLYDRSASMTPPGREGDEQLRRTVSLTDASDYLSFADGIGANIVNVGADQEPYIFENQEALPRKATTAVKTSFHITRVQNPEDLDPFAALAHEGHSDAVSTSARPTQTFNAVTAPTQNFTGSSQAAGIPSVNTAASPGSNFAPAHTRPQMDIQGDSFPAPVHHGNDNAFVGYTQPLYNGPPAAVPGEEMEILTHVESHRGGAVKPPSVYQQHQHQFAHPPALSSRRPGFPLIHPTTSPNIASNWRWECCQPHKSLFSFGSKQSFTMTLEDKMCKRSECHHVKCNRCCEFDITRNHRGLDIGIEDA